MNKKTKITLGLFIVLAFSVVQFLGGFDSSPRKPLSSEYLEDKTEISLFGQNDLLENRNFSKEINRLRTSDFSDFKRKKSVKVTKLNNKKKSKKKKLKKKSKKNAKKKKKEGKKKTADKTTEVAEENNIEDKEKELEETKEEASPYVLTDQAPASQNLDYWLNLLLNQASSKNYRDFYNAMKEEQISLQDYVDTLNFVYENANASQLKYMLEILMLETSDYSFIMSYKIHEKKSALSSKEKSIVQNYLLSYGETSIGLIALRRVLPQKEEDESIALAAKILVAASKRDLQASNSTQSNREDHVRGQNSEQTNTVANLNFYISLYSYLQNEDSTGLNSDAQKELRDLFIYLADNLNSGTNNSRNTTRI